MPTRLESSFDYDTDRIVEVLRDAADDIEEGGAATSFQNIEVVPRESVVERGVAVTYHSPVGED